MAAVMQLGELDYALGGVIVLDGGPIPPILLMANNTAEGAKELASYDGDDMRWMFYHGEDDGSFPAERTMELFTEIFDNLGVSDTILSMDVIPDMGHEQTLP